MNASAIDRLWGKSLDSHGVIYNSLICLLLIAPFVTYSNTYMGSVIIFSVQIIILNLMVRAGFKLVKLPNDIKAALLLFICTMIFSLSLVVLEYGVSRNFFFSSTRTLYLLVQLYFGLMVFNFLAVQTSPRNLKSIFGVSTLLIIACTAYLLTDPQLTMQLSLGDFNFAYNRRYIGYFALASSVYFSSVVLQRSQNTSDCFYLIASFALMIWLGGRGTVIAYLGALVMVSVLYYFHHKLYRQNLLLLALLLCISCVVSLPVSIYEWNGLNRFMSIEQTLGAIESSSAIARLALWTESLEILSDRPWIGVGADGFKMFTSSRFFQPHNVIFQTLVEFGVVGTLCLIYLISRGAWFAISVCRRVCDPYLYPILAVVIALLVQSMVSGNLYHAGSIAQFLFFTSLALSRSAYLLSVKSNV